MKELKEWINCFQPDLLPSKPTPEKLSRIISKLKTTRPFSKITVTNGCFDMLHHGHISLLKNSKKLGGHLSSLVVGINSDRAIKELKGESRPIISEEARLFSIRQLSCVSFAFIFDSTDFSPYLNAMGKCIFAKGPYYERIAQKEFNVLKANGGSWARVPLDFEVSTTSIIEKIKSK